LIDAAADEHGGRRADERRLDRDNQQTPHGLTNGLALGHRVSPLALAWANASSDPLTLALALRRCDRKICDLHAERGLIGISQIWSGVRP
jgi:hypothetical protein